MRVCLSSVRPLQDILNHVINDIEAFMGRVAAVAPKEDKKKNKKKKNKKKKCKGKTLQET